MILLIFTVQRKFAGLQVAERTLLFAGSLQRQVSPPCETLPPKSTWLATDQEQDKRYDTKHAPHSMERIPPIQ